MRIEIIGANNLRLRLRSMPRNMRGDVRKAMQLSVGLIHRHSTGIVPVDTSRLKNSIFWDADYERTENSITGIVGTNVEYSPYVEFGTRNMRAQPYLRPALLDNVNAIVSIFAHEMGDSIYG